MLEGVFLKRDLHHGKSPETGSGSEAYILPFIMRFQYSQGRPYFLRIHMLGSKQVGANAHLRGRSIQLGVCHWHFLIVQQP